MILIKTSALNFEKPSYTTRQSSIAMPGRRPRLGDPRRVAALRRTAASLFLFSRWTYRLPLDRRELREREPFPG
jgi:hypothetical protein